MCALEVWLAGVGNLTSRACTPSVAPSCTHRRPDAVRGRLDTAKMEFNRLVAQIKELRKVGGKSGAGGMGLGKGREGGNPWSGKGASEPARDGVVQRSPAQSPGPWPPAAAMHRTPAPRRLAPDHPLRPPHSPAWPCRPSRMPHSSRRTPRP